MECFRKKVSKPIRKLTKVLILVVMECFRKQEVQFDRRQNEGFNPCCNGMFSKGLQERKDELLRGFNPCCNGMFSKVVKAENKAV